MKKLLALVLMTALCVGCLASCGVFGVRSIRYANDETKSFLLDDYSPKWAKPGDTVVLRAHLIMDAGLILYANGVEIPKVQEGLGYYWEYAFTMPDEDVVISYKLFGWD